MNWATRLGIWLESRRKVPQRSLDAIVADLRKEIKDSQQIPSTLVKELTMLKVRMDRVELITGLKRDPVAITLQGEARIS